MHKLKLFLILLFMSGPFMLKAQDNELKKDGAEAPEYLKIKVDAEKIDLDWQLIL